MDSTGLDRGVVSGDSEVIIVVQQGGGGGV